MEEKLSIMNSRFNKRVLIDMFVWNDDRDSSRHIIYVRKSLQRIIYMPESYWIVTSTAYRLAFHKSVGMHNTGKNVCNSSVPQVADLSQSHIGKHFMVA